MNWLEQAFGVQTTLLMGLLAAIGSGMLIGLERERNKGQGQHRKPAGLRTFTITAFAGALAHGLGSPGLVPVGLLAVTALAGMAYVRSHERDPGLTTEMALLATYLIGVLCVQAPLLGAPAGVALTALLAARTRLHRFATRVLREEELHDGLLLAALGLIVLPLMPADPLPWLAGLKAHSLMGLLLLLLALQLAGHVALRLMGPQTGLALSGLMSGLVSSTATIAAMGSQARQQPALSGAFAAGAIMSTAATWMQAALMLLAMAPSHALHFLPLGLTGMVCAGGLGLMLARRSSPGAIVTAKPDGAMAAAKDGVPAATATATAIDAAEPPPHTAAGSNGERRGPLRLREATILALLLSSVVVLVNWAQQQFGNSGLFGAVALSSLADAHAPVASLGAMAQHGQIPPTQMLQGVLLAIGCNSLTRSLTAWLSGGRRFATLVVAALGLSWLACGLVYLAWSVR